MWVVSDYFSVVDLMNKLISRAQWFLIAQSATKIATATALLIGVCGVVFGDGGTLTISFVSGGE